MKIIKKIFILAVLISNTVLCQNVEKDWVDFNSVNWRVKYVADKSNYAEIPTQGRLVFENLISKKSVKFYIYLKSEVDNKFHQKINNLIPILNCNMDINKMAIQSFFFGDYYYMLSFCNVCFVSENKDCEVLSISLKEYVKR